MLRILVCFVRRPPILYVAFPDGIIDQFGAETFRNIQIQSFPSLSLCTGECLPTKNKLARTHTHTRTMLFFPLVTSGGQLMTENKWMEGENRREIVC